jgi:isopenicillin N synthase-like dioxygenase
VIIIPSAQREATQFGDGVVTLKGRMLHLLAAGLKQKPKMLDEVVRDRTTTTVLALMQAGKQYV